MIFGDMLVGERIKLQDVDRRDDFSIGDEVLILGEVVEVSKSKHMDSADFSIGRQYIVDVDVLDGAYRDKVCSVLLQSRNVFPNISPKEAYLSGMEDSWDIIKKLIILSKSSHEYVEDLKKLFDVNEESDIVMEYPPKYVGEKLNEFERESLCIGDVVRSSKYKLGLVVKIHDNDDGGHMFLILWGNHSSTWEYPKDIIRTGERIDISKMLKDAVAWKE